MSQRFEIRKQRLGFLYGLISGIAFSITAWGIDAIVLASSHVSYPWIKFLPGLIITSLIGGLVGWASVKISNGLVTIILWIVFAMIMVWLTIWVPFNSTPYLLKGIATGFNRLDRLSDGSQCQSISHCCHHCDCFTCCMERIKNGLDV